ncbi:MAG: calcineurin [Ruminococcaceae bacterium]|nr:calcineurin [Oscillospiraceae bacterium]
MIYVTSDIHGRADCLKKLLDHVRFSEDEDNWLYILGDVIDRNNKGGVDILKWLLLQTNVQLILGNHEQMLLANKWVFQEISEESIDNIDGKKLGMLSLWESNGARCTMQALSKESPETRQDIVEYLEDCPIIDVVSVRGRRYVLVHSGLGNYSPDKKISDYSMDELLWERPTLDTEYNPQKFTVIFGHTPTVAYSEQYKDRMIKTDSWWNIDTGAAMDGGRPMLLCLDNCKEYYIDGSGEVIEI